jgi:hypothetical protein
MAALFLCKKDNLGACDGTGGLSSREGCATMAELQELELARVSRPKIGCGFFLVEWLSKRVVTGGPMPRRKSRGLLPYDCRTRNIQAEAASKGEATGMQPPRFSLLPAWPTRSRRQFRNTLAIPLPPHSRQRSCGIRLSIGNAGLRVRLYPNVQ